MNRILISLCILMGGISIAYASASAPGQLQQIEALQHRADKLTFGETDLNSYHLAKAHAWLNLSLSEYYEKEESTDIITAAVAQAETLLNELENKKTDISLDTPRQFPGSDTVRPDLWDKIDAMKKLEKFSCAHLPIAEAEVMLVWTGHEEQESGWSHAETYARSAEDLIYSAKVAMDNCAAAAPVVAVVPVMEKITLSSDTMFDFNKSALNPSALARLDQLADSIKAATKLDEVVLIGHTDRMRADGHEERNQLLSEQRAESIKQYLIGKGIPEDKIKASGAGSTQPLVQCSTKMSRYKQMLCLQPNRRVEIILRGEK